MKRAIAKLWPELYKATEDEVKLAGAIHDEILLLVREDKAEFWVETLQKTMEAAEAEWLGPIPASADAHYGRTWAEAKG